MKKLKTAMVVGLAAGVFGSAVAAADWPQWGGNTLGRNMFAAGATGLPDKFEPGDFKQGTEDVDLSSAKNVKWAAKLGTQSYGNTTISNGKIFVGTNNDSMRDPKHPGDRSILLCLDEKSGDFLWQLVIPKLKSGKVNDWESLGLLSSPTVVGNRLYVVSSRCEVLSASGGGVDAGMFDGQVLHFAADQSESLRHRSPYSISDLSTSGEDLLVASWFQVRCIDAAGDERWQVEHVGLTQMLRVSSDGRMIAVAGDNQNDYTRENQVLLIDANATPYLQQEGEDIDADLAAFGGEESAGASFVRKDGTVWTTDKDGILLALLASEITAVTGQTPSQIYADLTDRYGDPAYERVDAPATAAQKAALGSLQGDAITAEELAGDPITAKLSEAPGNGAAIGGLKVTTHRAWFAARPSGTEDVYKIYAESFGGPEHLAQVQREAKAIVDAALGGS